MAGLMNVLRTACSVSLLVFLLASSATSQVLTSDQVLRIRFTVSSAWSSFPPPDVMRINLGLVQVVQAFTARNVSLHDCSSGTKQLLGTASDPSFGGYVGTLSLFPSNSFTCCNSPWTFGAPTAIDFTTIHNGTIDGILEFSIATGCMNIPLSQVGMTFLRASGPAGGTPISPDATITEISIGPRLQVLPGLCGGVNSLDLTGAQPGNPIIFGLDLSGGSAMVCPGVTVDLPAPIIMGILSAAGTAGCGPQGTASLNLFAPLASCGVTVIAQALEVGPTGCIPSNSVAVTL
ncbi:MAG: hypothetical protein CMJ83_08685 [Planctomycetes bacterium]|nr:hypothetical protein [Planctomycetota bacterium]